MSATNTEGDPSPSADEGGRTARSRADVRLRYETLGRTLEARTREIDDQDRRLSTARGLSFLVSGGLALVGLFRPSALVWTLAAAGFVVFLAFVVRHAVVSTRQFELTRRQRWCGDALARLGGTYRAPEGEPRRRGDAHKNADHAYTGDLDVFGSVSLFEQLDTTQTPGGSSLLARWLDEPASPAVVATRQTAARELARSERLREEMALEGMRAGKIDRDARPFLVWSREEARLAPHKTRLLPLALLPATTVVLSILDASSTSTWSRAWIATLALQIVVLVVLRARLEPVLAPITLKQSPLGTYHGLMRLLELHPFEADRLRTLQGELKRTDGTASAAMRKLDGLASLASVRHNALVHVLADVFLLWDVWIAAMLDRWRAAHGSHVDRWLEALAELEALAALGTYADEHPDWAWPDVATTAACFVARGLGHPLIGDDSRVVNDVELNGATRALMITGSNMSGKSTMLRSMGVAAVLAQAGAPVCAASLRMSPLRVMTSMRVGDALDRGVSRFYMEVTKLERVVAAAAAPDKSTPDAGESALMFLLDEVLHGTNSRERNIGAKAVVSYLVSEGAIGAVSSHDLGLVELETLTGGRVRNVHFEDHIENGRMCFDFLMKPGAVETSNALRLMRDVGIDVPGLDG